MRKLTFTPATLNKYGRKSHKLGTVHDGGIDGLYFYGFDRIPRKLKKQAKRRINGKMIWVFSKPDKTQLRDPSFMWLECFKSIL